MDAHWHTIEANICSSCRHFGKEGCQTGDESKCSLKRLFSNVCLAIREIAETKPPAYIPVIRKKVCRFCRNQDLRGRCVIRNNQDCALDSNAETVVRLMSRMPIDMRLSGIPAVLDNPLARGNA